MADPVVDSLRLIAMELGEACMICGRKQSRMKVMDGEGAGWVTCGRCSFRQPWATEDLPYRKERVLVRLTAEEREKLEDLGRRAGMQAGWVIRVAVMKLLKEVEG